MSDSPSVLFSVNILKVILRVNWGPIKIVFHVMLELKSGLTVKQRPVSFFRLFFFVFLSPEWGNLNWAMFVQLHTGAVWQTIIDWQSLLSMSQLLSSCQTKRQLYVDLLYIGIRLSLSVLCLLPSFTFLEDLLSESLLFGFQDEIITSHFMIDGGLLDPSLVFSFSPVSQYVCVCR